MKQKRATRGMVGFIVDKMHVSTSDKGILREFYNRLVSNPANMTLANKQARKDVYRLALDLHHENQNIVREFRL